MNSWRLTKLRYSSRRQVLEGEGARVGGRWNRPGLPLVYASENSSLAILEALVHVTERDLPKSLVAVRIAIPANVHVTRIAAENLPATWHDVDSAECIAIGSKWIESRVGLVLRVPSAANSLEENVLLNPLHPDIEDCRVDDPVPIVFDPRVVGFVRA